MRHQREYEEWARRKRYEKEQRRIDRDGPLKRLIAVWGPLLRKTTKAAERVKE